MDHAGTGSQEAAGRTKWVKKSPGPVIGPGCLLHCVVRPRRNRYTSRSCLLFRVPSMCRIARKVCLSSIIYLHFHLMRKGQYITPHLQKGGFFVGVLCRIIGEAGEKQTFSKQNLTILFILTDSGVGLCHRAPVGAVQRSTTSPDAQGPTRDYQRAAHA